MGSRVPMNYWKRMAMMLMRSSTTSTMGGGGNLSRTFVTSTSPRMEPVAAQPRYGDHYYSQQQQKQSPKRPVKGDYVPVYVSAGLILLAGIIGVHTLNQQLRHNPSVRLKKTKRETFPEVESPDEVIEESDRLINKSFFRKVAHLQEFDRDHAIPDPIRGDVYTRPRHAETLKSVGVDPRAA